MKLTEKQASIRGVRRLAIVAACAAFGIATCGSALALSMTVNAPAATENSGATKTPEVLNVRAGEMAGNLLNKVTPKYPEKAKKARVQGTVVLHALIGKDGAIKDLRVVSGPEMLRKSSIDAVKQWTYKPYLLNGNPVEVKTTINVTYSLEK